MVRVFAGFGADRVRQTDRRVLWEFRRWCGMEGEGDWWWFVEEVSHSSGQTDDRDYLIG